MLAYSGGHRAAAARADLRGRFVLVLHPGTYTFRTGYAGGVRRFSSRVVTVGPSIGSIRLIVDRRPRVGPPHR